MSRRMVKKGTENDTYDWTRNDAFTIQLSPFLVKTRNINIISLLNRSLVIFLVRITEYIVSLRALEEDPF